MQQANTYTPPQVRDYGTLLELTAAVDVNFVGVATNVVMAAMSNPMGNPHATDPSLQSGGAGGVIGGGGGSGGGAGGAGGGGGGGVADLLGGGGAGGKLPFTGFPVVLLAAIGAMVASAGAALRGLLRRNET
jgi:hypothetical protein